MSHEHDACSLGDFGVSVGARGVQRRPRVGVLQIDGGALMDNEILAMTTVIKPGFIIRFLSSYSSYHVWRGS